MQAVQVQADPAKRLVLGVGALVLDHEGVLLIKRGTPPSKGSWSLPGGKVEFGESLTEALEREVLEETGLHVQVGELAATYERLPAEHEEKSRMADVILSQIHEEMIQDSIQGTGTNHYVVLDYFCKCTGGQLQAGDDATEVAWIAWNDLASLSLTPLTMNLIQRASITVTSR